MSIPTDIKLLLEHSGRSHDRWAEQYQRVHRWCERLEQPIRLSRHDPEACLDDYYAFSLNSYHFQDWLQKDNAWAYLSCDAKASLGKSFKLCSQIANSNKHLNLRQGEQDATLQSTEELEWNSTTDVWANLQQVYVDNLDAFDLASDRIEAWDQYIRDKLIAPN